ncbi:MAG: hypothetical protein ACFFFG_17830 [Candidatus Thorarchaeota archaeon]
MGFELDQQGITWSGAGMKVLFDLVLFLIGWLFFTYVPEEQAKTWALALVLMIVGGYLLVKHVPLLLSGLMVEESITTPRICLACHFANPSI